MARSLTLVTASLVLVACGKKPAPEPTDVGATPTAPAAAQNPPEPAPFTVTYTFRDKADGPVTQFVLTSDGALVATLDKPPTRYIGKLDASELETVSRMIAAPALRALPEVSTNGDKPIVELEVTGAKALVWRRRVVGIPPDVALPLFNRLEGWQEFAKREERPSGVLRLDVTRIDPTTKDNELLSVNGNSLVLVTRNGKAVGLGSVGQSDLDRLRIAVSALEGLRPPVADDKLADHELHLERTDDTSFDLKLEGAVPLAVDTVFALLEPLRTATKPVVAFDKFTAEIRTVIDGKKGPVEVLTVDANGGLTLTSNGKPAGTGEAEIQDLWGLRSSLVGYDKLAKGAFPRAHTTEDLVFTIDVGGATHQVYTPRYEPEPGTGKLVVVFGRLRKAITAPAAEDK